MSLSTKVILVCATTLLLSYSSFGSPINSDKPNSTKCDYSQIWNDIIFIFDASQATGDNNLGDMWGLVQSLTPWMNVQKTGYTTSNNFVQLGIITYASKAKLVAPLGSLDQDDIYDKYLTFEKGDTGTNIEDSIQLAVSQFNSSAHRLNSKKVIVLMATTYNDGGYEAPQRIANSFMEDGGIVIAYDYLPNHGLPSTLLEQIASPGYFIYSPESTMTTLLDALCDANSFCPKKFLPFKTNARQSPIEDCYLAVNIQNNYTSAKHNCQYGYNNGSISVHLTLEKDTFIKTHYNEAQDFYIGLSLDPFSNNWLWEDGTPLSESYQPWINGQKPTDPTRGRCVYVAKGTDYWIQTDCRNAFYYTCQTHPCAPSHYCTIDQI